MFTGIVETQGTISKVQNNPDNFIVTINVTGTDFLSDCHVGDSISCCGICLTVIEFSNESTTESAWFKVGISQETLRRTSIEKMWKEKSKLNLERAMGMGNHRFGGHYVQGHVDTVATVIEKDSEGDSINHGFQLRDKEYEEFIVEKGFITVDGASLTVTKVEPEGKFWISMIKHTQEVLVPREIGDQVNIEVDLTGKLIAKQVKLYMDKYMKKD